jgi:hypothetical protein
MSERSHLLPQKLNSLTSKNNTEPVADRSAFVCNSFFFRIKSCPFGFEGCHFLSIGIFVLGIRIQVFFQSVKSNQVHFLVEIQESKNQKIINSVQFQASDYSTKQVCEKKETQI